MATSARLEELLQKFGENPRRYFAPLANEHRKLGDLEQAIALCRTHLPQQPQHVSGHIVLAQALFEAGNTPDARETFELALDLDPENLIALRYLGDIARTQGDFPTARQWYERVLDADPRNDEIARLVRELDNGAAAVAATAPTRAAEPASEFSQAQPEAALPTAMLPNEPESASLEVPAQAPAETTEDLAAAWQHEVSALDSEPTFASADAESQATPEATVDELEPVNIETLAFAEESVAEPVAEHAAAELALGADAHPDAESEAGDAVEMPNEAWAEPDQEFVATVPPVETSAVAAPPVFTEIDYSVFEAVADEDEPVGVTPPPVDQEPTPAYEDDKAEELAAEPPAPTADDWFATPNVREQDAQVAEVVSESSFDLDAAFQSVLPNSADEIEEGIFVSQTPVADIDDLADPVPSDWVPKAIAEEPVAEADQESQFAAADGVDDAFATLDRMNESIEADIVASGMLLPDEEYTVDAVIEVTQEVPEEDVPSAIARTPDMGVPAIEAAPLTFVTETMAELYLQQGFRDEALAVYRQLLTMNPADAVLTARVRALEGDSQPSESWSTRLDSAAPAAARAHADSAGQSMRAFLGVFARRRAPMRRRAPVQTEAPAAPPESGLSALFGGGNGSDDGAAAVLAGAFAQPNAALESLPGRPTRAAAAELSLGEVFGGGAPGNASRTATFDEFFSTGNVDQAPKSPLDEEGSDMEQFTAWLEGLKKK